MLMKETVYLGDSFASEEQSLSYIDGVGECGAGFDELSDFLLDVGDELNAHLILEVKYWGRSSWLCHHQ